MSDQTTTDSPAADADCSSAIALEALINERERARAAIRFTLASDDYNFDLVEAIESLVATLDDEEAGHAETSRLWGLAKEEVKRLRTALTTISDNNAGCCEGSALEECGECYQLAERLIHVARETLAVETVI